MCTVIREQQSKTKRWQVQPRDQEPPAGNQSRGSFAKPATGADKWECLVSSRNNLIFWFSACSWRRKAATCSSEIDHPNPKEFYNITGEMKIKFPGAAVFRISHVGHLQRGRREREGPAFLNLCIALFHEQCVYVCIQLLFKYIFLLRKVLFDYSLSAGSFRGQVSNISFFSNHSMTQSGAACHDICVMCNTRDLPAQVGLLAILLMKKKKKKKNAALYMSV